MIAVDVSAAQTALAAFTAAGTLVTVYYAGRALRAKTEADKGVRELDMVKVSQASLESALAQNTADNVALRAENARQAARHAEERAEDAATLAEVRAECAAKQAECRDQQIRCQEQIRDLTNRLMETQRQVAETARRAKG